jgi:hypothetical protein
MNKSGLSFVAYAATAAAAFLSYLPPMDVFLRRREKEELAVTSIKNILGGVSTLILKYGCSIIYIS